MARDVPRRVASLKGFLSLSALLLGLFAAGHASAQAPVCPDTGTGTSATFPATCSKEVRILNNTAGRIYVVLQGSIIAQPAIGCPAGDVWLQRALGETKQCHPVTHDYHIYINPVTGIGKGQTASINLPWWSKRLANADDRYVDWWRSGRLYIFDDPAALADIYEKERFKVQVQFAQGSPVPACKKGAGSTCSSVQIWEVSPDAELGTQTPAQLNEYTFASVQGPEDNFDFVNLNQNYNVSNVDQAYLPLAMEPIRTPADIGYMGTTISVADFRKNLAAFAGVASPGATPTKWPIYNNPNINGALVYPLAGIRVPSAETVLNFYMKPYFMGGELAPQNIPQLIPYKSANSIPPALVTRMTTQWTNCTNPSDTSKCPKSGKVDWSTFYQALYQTFVQNYALYLQNVADGTCTPPSPNFLAQLPGSNPPVPENKYALLRFIYGWVPFNVGCQASVVKSLELPTVGQGFKTPITYVQVQYDYDVMPQIALSDAFNPYTPMVHNAVTVGGLSSNAYAFSIDDKTAFQSNSGNGLIFAVGGVKGLPNMTQILPSVPNPSYKWDFGVTLGTPAKGATQWTKYGICSPLATTGFPANPNLALGVDPAISNFPCPITLEDSNGQTYQLTIKQAAVPPSPIWPLYTQPSGVDPKVVSCATSEQSDWCTFVNETTIPAGQPNGPLYSLSTRVPLAN